ncbi:hypothetical protein GQ457_02G033590 [Hibiscus cannabinus]
MASPVLENIIERPRKHRSSERVIPILGVPCNVVSAFVAFLYSSRCEEDQLGKYGIHLLALSHVYSVPQLKQRCSKGVGQRLTVENAVDVLQLASLYDATDLYLKCMKHIAAHFKYVEQTEAWMGKKGEKKIGRRWGSVSGRVRFRSGPFQVGFISGRVHFRSGSFQVGSEADNWQVNSGSGRLQVGFISGRVHFRSVSFQVGFISSRVNNMSGSKQVGFKTGRVKSDLGRMQVGFGCYSNRSDSVPGQHQSVTDRVRVIAASGQTRF